MDKTINPLYGTTHIFNALIPHQAKHFVRKNPKLVPGFEQRLILKKRIPGGRSILNSL